MSEPELQKAGEIERLYAVRRNSFLPRKWALETAMQIPILIESLPAGRGFRARAAAPFSVDVESTERASVIAEAKRVVDHLMADGQVVFVDVGPSNAAAALIGLLDMDDPEAQKWWQYVEAFRDECDALTFPGESSGANE